MKVKASILKKAVKEVVKNPENEELIEQMLRVDEAHCTEEEIAEGTCGYGEDGKIGRKPAGSHLMKERFQKLANIK